MTPLEIRHGDVLEQLREMPRHSVHCVFTSPPYWKVRDYGVSGQLGQEKTLAEHLENLVKVFREVRRVLHPTGTLWVNYGDVLSQNGRPLSEAEQVANRQRSAERGYRSNVFARQWQRAHGTARGSGLPEKSLLLIPERLALALQDDGWLLRSQIVWQKPNANSESVQDRPSRDHEMIYLLTPGPRYFFDEWGIRRNTVYNADGSFWGSKLRTVWSVATVPTRSGHPAVFPPELPRRGILLGSSQLGCCPGCLSPVQPVYVKDQPQRDAQRRCGGDHLGEYNGKARRDYAASLSQDPSATKARILAGMRSRRLVGGKPTCICLQSLAEAEPCRVLDPFAGEGTTNRVALELGRFATAIELNPVNVDFMRQDLEPIAQDWMRLRIRKREESTMGARR